MIEIFAMPTGKYYMGYHVCIVMLQPKVAISPEFEWITQEQRDRTNLWLAQTFAPIPVGEVVIAGPNMIMREEMFLEIARLPVDIVRCAPLNGTMH